MGAFNTVFLEWNCPSCHSVVELRVQFKYGDTWQHEYRVGERVEWGGNDVGRPGRRRVVVDGVGEACPRCGHADCDFYVLIEQDVISSVVPASGTYDFVASQGEPIVLEP